MRTLSPKMQGLVGALLFLAGIVAALWLAPRDTRAADAKDARLKSLMNERLTALREIATAVKALNRSGMVTPDQLYAANQAVNNSELEMSETDQQRAAILDRMLTEAKNFETLSRTPSLLSLDQQAPLKAKVARIDVEIAIERAKANK